MSTQPSPSAANDADSLYLPDHPSWANPSEPCNAGYNPVAARMLAKSYGLIAANPRQSASYLHATVFALDCVNIPISHRQRLRAEYVIAQGYAAQYNFVTALKWVDEALLVTQLVPEHPSYVDLLELRGNLNIHRLELGAAADDLYETVVRLRMRPQPWDGDLVLQLVDALVSYAQVVFYLSDPDSMQRSLDEARGLLRLVPLDHDCGPRVAGIEFAQALLHRQRGKAAEAIPLAARSATYFEQHANACTANRAKILLASAYLDLAMALPKGTDRRAHLTPARSHLAAARALAYHSGDFDGAALTILERVRLDRASGSRRDRVRRLRFVIDSALRQRSTILLTQALTSLGDEYRSLGKLDDARTTYREALAALGNHEITMLAAPIHKGLEMLR